MATIRVKNSCVFKFTTHYDNVVEIEDEATVYIARVFNGLFIEDFN